MTKKATIDHPEMVDSYAIFMVGAKRMHHKFQVIVRTDANIGETAQLSPYGVECLLVPDAATHNKPAILVTAADWLKLRGVLQLN